MARTSVVEGTAVSEGVEDDDELLGPRRGRTALFTALAVGSVLAVLIGILATGEPASSKLADSPLLGRRAPRISGPSLLSEPGSSGGVAPAKDFDLADERGRWVVVNFFATWCVPCREEHLHLVRFAAAHEEPDDARVVSVVFSDEPDDVRRFFSERGGAWSVVEDTTGIVPAWGVTGVPESYLVDPGGVVVAKIVGGVTAERLEELLGRAGVRPAGER